MSCKYGEYRSPEHLLFFLFGSFDYLLFLLFNYYCSIFRNKIILVLNNYDKFFFSEKKTYNCDQCGSRFSQMCSLKIHQRRHSGVKPYVCDICDTSFYAAAYLSAHKEKKHGIHPARRRKRRKVIAVPLHYAPVVNHCLYCALHCFCVIPFLSECELVFSEVIVNSVSFSFNSRWHRSAWKGPYTLRPVSQQSPQGCLRNSANIGLVENRLFSISEGGMSATSFLHSSFLQAVSAVMLWPVYVQKVPQALEHLCPAHRQTRCVVCCACQSICPFIPTDSGVPRTVDPQKSL